MIIYKRYILLYPLDIIKKFKEAFNETTVSVAFRAGDTISTVTDRHGKGYYDFWKTLNHNYLFLFVIECYILFTFILTYPNRKYI